LNESTKTENIAAMHKRRNRLEAAAYRALTVVGALSGAAVGEVAAEARD